MQTNTQTVLQHGESVWTHTQRLICGQFEGFRLPDWLVANYHFIVNNLHEWQVIRQYNIYHDCGKPQCLQIDSEGKRHFPNHAAVSRQVWLEYCPDQSIIAELIGLDMIFHTENEQLILQRGLSVQTILTLMLTAYAEIHANAEMFGGIESTSFKIKYKALEKRSRRVFEALNLGHQDAYAYVIVRNDMAQAHQAVQGTHAAIEMLKSQHQHPSLIYVVVRDEKKLKKVMAQLIENNIQFSIFREPMQGNTITALCTEPLPNADPRRGFLQKFQLMK